jgi:cytochrome c-type biogenesis protein CcmH/NrfG
MAIKSFKIETLQKKFFIIAGAFVCLVIAFFFVKWCVANALATQADTKELADFAILAAPGDPQTHYALAVLSEQAFAPDELAKSLDEFEQAAALAPNDYRLWIALGKARERSGDAGGAELALKKSLELAPNYAQVRWTLGNILLRQGKTSEAFVELRKASEADKSFINPVILAAWQIFEGDLVQIKQNLDAAPQTNSALAIFLAKQKRFEEALEAWSAIPLEDRKITFKDARAELSREMIAAKKYRNALKIQEQAGETDTFIQGKISNGGFETNVKTKEASVFEWQIADGVQPQIGFDDKEKHGGNKSLVFIFNSNDGTEFRPVSQTIAIESGKKYSFEGFYKSDLKTGATLRWEIVDASNGKILAATEPVSKNSEWTIMKVEFNAPESVEAVTLQLVRETCKIAICPISGKVWFDDFSLN